MKKKFKDFGKNHTGNYSICKLCLLHIPDLEFRLFLLAGLLQIIVYQLTLNFACFCFKQANEKNSAASTKGPALNNLQTFSNENNRRL